MGDDKRKSEIRDMAAEAGSLTEFALRQLREEIIAGQLPPGTKLQIDDLKARLGISASPLREALARLVSVGFVAAESQRGFRVTPMSREDLADITLARGVVEEAALRLSIIKGDDAWEAQLLGAFHRLDRAIQRIDNRGPGSVVEFCDLHKAFHVALIAACGSSRLLEEQARLYDQAERYRRRMMEGFIATIGTDLTIEHRKLLDLALSRDVEGACKMLRQHLGHTIDFCYDSTPAATGRMPGRTRKRTAR